MIDQWYFDIGDENTYGPFPMETLRKWAASGDLMPTHRVRNADSSEWMIAAYVPGLESTLAPDQEIHSDQEASGSVPSSKSFGSIVRNLGRKKKTPSASSVSTESSGLVGGKAGPPAEPPDIVALCDELLNTAYERGASDIHIDPEELVVLVQLRIDGQLEPLRKLPKALHGPVIGRFKVLSRMDIAERREAQDGQFTCCLGPEERRIQIRSACLPTTHGERITLRLLAMEAERLTLNRLGMSRDATKIFADVAGQKQGMVLITGPTGSGKSTTLYAALRHRLAHNPGRIITVEDPVEFDIIGVAQVEVDSADKLRFDSALRNMLRSDPDVIMIGEIRDYDSADIAVKAALTGHLVFSSLHTNSAAGVITRLVDMGIEPYQVAATLRLVVAQRLIRKLCSDCHQPRDLTEAEATSIGRPEAAGSTIYEPGRCQKCNQRGYRGRVGLFELLFVDEELARRIGEGCNEGDIVRHARKKKRRSLHDDAAHKLLTGVVSYSDLVSQLAK